MWELSQNGHAHTDGAIEPSLVVSFTGRARRGGSPWVVEHVGTHVRATFPQLGVSWPRRYVACPPRMNAEQHLEIHVHLPLTPAYLSTIENTRHTRQAGDLTLDIYLELVHIPVLQDVDERLATFRRGQAHSENEIRLSVKISQNEWLAILTKVGHDQIDIFEIPSRTKVDLPGFPEAMVDLRAAHTSYRESNWQDTIVRARQSCEDILKKLGNGDIQKGAIALGELVFPAEEDRPRREYVDSVCRAIRSLRNAAGHADGDVRFRANRADADAALGLALELFRYVASAIPRSTTP